MIEQNPVESRKDWMLIIFRVSGKANLFNQCHQFWQNENYPVALTSPEMMNQKIEYIHQNPVRAGFVSEASEYLYSSASPLKVLEV